MMVATFNVYELERRLIEYLDKNLKGVPFLQLRTELDLPMEHFKTFLQSMRKLEKSKQIKVEFIKGVRTIFRTSAL